MRRLTLTAAVLVLVAAGPALAGQDGEERMYGAHGEYQGRATPDGANPRQKSLYDEHGAYKGRLMTDPNTGETRAYDNHGKHLGRTTGGQVPDQKK